MKLCVDCKHYRETVFLDAHEELSPGDFPSMTETYRTDVCVATPTVDPVSGLRRVRSARSARANATACGPDAVWFEPKS